MESRAITGITVIIEGDSGVESVKISSSSLNVKNMLNKIETFYMSLVLVLMFYLISDIIVTSLATRSGQNSGSNLTISWSSNRTFLKSSCVTLDR